MKTYALLTALMALTAAPSFPSIIKRPPVKVVDIAYADLVCNEADQACIHEIITIVAENSKIGLIFKQTYLNELGSRLDHVHPMKFLTTIVNDPQLHVCLDLLWPDSFKRAGFMDGFGANMTREADKGKLNAHIVPFAEELKLTPEEIEPYIKTRAWEDLISHILRS